MIDLPDDSVLVFIAGVPLEEAPIVLLPVHYTVLYKGRTHANFPLPLSASGWSWVDAAVTCPPPGTVSFAPASGQL